ncbi:MAG: cob(I)yrinic acid a,c-diamide adenosyltransferase [Candidatus Bilamarchaeaceae archaeon]
MSIITKSGDSGTTATADGRRVSKDDPLIHLYGELDALNAAIGAALCFMESKRNKATLTEVQEQIFKIGAHLGESKPAVSDKETVKMENEIHFMEEKLHSLHHFIIPRGTKGCCFLHLARVSARSVERRLAGMKAHKEYLAYFNRLSDLLFVMARWENKEEGVEEQIWKDWAD